jgi:hypothetical protein
VTPAPSRRAVKDGLGVHRHLAGWKPDRPDHRDPVMRCSRFGAVLQPPSASLYPLYASVQIYDQGAEGSCTANAGCSLVLWLEAKAGHFDWKPSRQNLYKSERIAEGTPLAEDSGAQIRDVMQALRVYGVCSEGLDPYEDTAASYSAPISDLARADALKHRALLFYACPDLRTIKASILQGFPVEIGFTVYQNMMSAAAAASGLVLYPESGEEVEGGHAVVVIGYDNAKKIGGDVGAVLCRNSWGAGWGQSGDFWLPYRYFENNLASDFWTLRAGVASASAVAA